MAQEGSLAQILSLHDAFVTYVPLRNEVPFETLCPLPTGTVYGIAPHATLDPLQEARKAMTTLEHMRVCVLLPGRHYDRCGTRFGRGGGWYDRFLAETPSEWTRVGFCFTHQFSLEPLIRQVWDQAVDYVCVVDKDSGVLTLHETHARKI